MLPLKDTRTYRNTQGYNKIEPKRKKILLFRENFTHFKTDFCLKLLKQTFERQGAHRTKWH